MEIVKLDISHAQNIYDLFLEQFGKESWTKKQIEDSLKNPATSFYALKLENNFVCIASILESIDTVDLLDIATSHKYKRQGYAKTLLNYLIKLKNKTFCLEVKSKNLPAINFYTSIGFKTVHMRKNYYKDGDTALCMIKN